MIIYLDTSALVKRYVREQGSDQVKDWVDVAEFVGSSVLTRPEMASALSRAEKNGYLSANEAQELRRQFLADWTAIAEMSVTDHFIQKSENLAWAQQLRGYDAVHLAAALLWQELLQTPITLVTYDRQLWEAGRRAGLLVLPEAIR